MKGASMFPVSFRVSMLLAAVFAVGLFGICLVAIDSLGPYFSTREKPFEHLFGFRTRIIIGLVSLALMAQYVIVVAMDNMHH